MTTKQMRDEWQRLSDTATFAPWKQAKQEYDSHEEMARETALAYSRGGHVLHYLVVAGAQFPAFTGNGPSSKANAAFIAAAREAVPALLQDVERLALDFANCADVGRRLEAQLAAMTAERDAVTRHRDKWRDNYMTVADAVAPESESAEHLADITRKARNDRDHYKQVFDESCEHVAEACDMLGFNRSDGPRDTWTLRESCGRVVRERDAARTERDASIAKFEGAWKELEVVEEQANQNRGQLQAMERRALAAEKRIHELERDNATLNGAQERGQQELARLREEVQKVAAFVPYVAALEAEHAAVAELDEHEAFACLVDPPCGGCDACTARIAHAAVEALRAVKL